MIKVQLFLDADSTDDRSRYLRRQETICVHPAATPPRQRRVWTYRFTKHRDVAPQAYALHDDEIRLTTFQRSTAESRGSDKARPRDDERGDSRERCYPTDDWKRKRARAAAATLVSVLAEEMIGEEGDIPHTVAAPLKILTEIACDAGALSIYYDKLLCSSYDLHRHYVMKPQNFRDDKLVPLSADDSYRA